ncbi:MAG TPA: DUF4339 domain-containing protein [Tepidisphaeraceae bacterium]|jgi:hypothetical protein|nr:DUF4339 domain-containing protein [Tepidisphaeraceae bacterium]
MANETRWFFARSGQQSGPVTISELKEMIGRGEVGPGDLVWHEGMGAWTPAGKTLELAANPAAPVAAAEIGYYAPAMGIPERALLNLRGHARPTGDTGDWPLDDQRLNQFQSALKLRKKITSAAGLYRLLLFLAIISFAGFFVAAVVTLLQNQNRMRTAMYGFVPFVALFLAFSVLYYFAERGTRRSHRWAPLTMLIIFIVSGAVQISSIIVTAHSMGSAQTGSDAVVGLVVILIFNGAFAIVSWKALAAIPRYLAQPAWCQELIVKAGL